MAIFPSTLRSISWLANGETVGLTVTSCEQPKKDRPIDRIIIFFIGPPDTSVWNFSLSLYVIHIGQVGENLKKITIYMMPE
jgi:hypothetical protein